MPNIKYPCRECNKSCKKNQKCICCDICNSWIHFKCLSITLTQFNVYANNSLLPFYCPHCLYENLPIECQESLNQSLVQDGEGYLSLDNIQTHFSNYNSDLNDLIILHINIRSLTKNIDGLAELILGFPYNPHVIAVTETKLSNKSNLRHAELPGYSMIHQDSLTKAGGVAIYLKDGFIYNNRPDLSFSNHEYEMLFIELTNNNKNMKNSLVGVIYRHPQNNIPDFTNKFSEHLSKIIAENKNVYITGDFNIDLNKVDYNDQVNNYANMLSSFNLYNTVSLSTRISDTTQTLLDHFYCNCQSQEINTSILLSDLSDHLPLLTTIKNTEPKIFNKKEFYYHRDYKKINIENIQSDTLLVINNLTEYFNKNEINIHEKYNLLIDELKVVLNKHIPLKKLSRKD